MTSGLLGEWGREALGYNTYRRRQRVRPLRPAALARVVWSSTLAPARRQYREFFSHCEYRTHDFGQEPGSIGHYTRLDYESDICAIPVADDTFDVVLCTEVLEHVPQPIDAIREMTRILRPGGTMLLSAPLGSILHQQPYHYYGGYTPYWYRRFLDMAGCDVVEIERNRGFFSLLGQETRRFRSHVWAGARGEVGAAGPLARLALFALAVASLPFAYGLPAIGGWLDSLDLETTATAGYHVVATKRPRGATASINSPRPLS